MGSKVGVFYETEELSGFEKAIFFADHLLLRRNQVE